MWCIMQHGTAWLGDGDGDDDDGDGDSDNDGDNDGDTGQSSVLRSLTCSPLAHLERADADHNS